MHDEVIPEDEDEDISLQSRFKSSLIIIMKIGDGVDERNETSGKKRQRQNFPSKGQSNEGDLDDDDSQTDMGEIVMQEADQEET